MTFNPFDENCHFIYKLDRASISSKMPGIDVTVKSAKGLARMCAPTWDMVRGIKAGTMSQTQYAYEYKKILDKNKIDIVSYLMAEACTTGGLLRFLCYCPDGAFCHTYLLMSWLQNELQIRHLVVRRLDHERRARQGVLTIDF